MKLGRRHFIYLFSPKTKAFSAYICTRKVTDLFRRLTNRRRVEENFFNRALLLLFFFKGCTLVLSLCILLPAFYIETDRLVIQLKLFFYSCFGAYIYDLVALYAGSRGTNAPITVLLQLIKS